MTASASDIVIVYTGGILNGSPSESLGGSPSSYPVTGVLNNLFSNLSEVDSDEGKIDYRCCYIFNNNSIDAIYNVRIYISYETANGASIEIGIKKSQETQRLTLSNSITTSGYLEFSYPDKDTVQADWDADAGIWATNIQTALNTIFESTEVTVSGSESVRVFNIKFDGDDDYRFHDFLTVNTSNLSPARTGSVSRVLAGAPINYIHDELDSELTVPADVEFVETDVDNPIEIGTLNKEEGFPLWFKRTCAAGTEAIQSDGFKLKILSNPIPS